MAAHAGRLLWHQYFYALARRLRQILYSMRTDDIHFGI